MSKQTRNIILPHDHGGNKNFLDTMPEDCLFERAAQVYAILGDEARIKLMYILCHREECVVNLAAIVGLSSPAVSHHLAKLKAANLVISKRVGKEVYYRAAMNDIADLLHHIIEKMLLASCPDIETSCRTCGCGHCGDKIANEASDDHDQHDHSCCTDDSLEKNHVEAGNHLHSHSHNHAHDHAHDYAEFQSLRPSHSVNNKSFSDEQNEATIRDVHDYLLSNLDKKLTIVELSHKFLINQTTLKSEFRRIYGSPIATYVRAAKIRKANSILREHPNISHTELASLVGYSSVAKFTKVYEQLTGESLPRSKANN